MMLWISRRAFLNLAPAFGLMPSLSRDARHGGRALLEGEGGRALLKAGGGRTRLGEDAEGTLGAVPASFPSQDPDLVRDMVAAAHGNVARVRELVAGRPALAKATWDWGYGDWETALGGASHMGNREIAEFLLASGATPTIFSSAMLGQLDVVKAYVAASPGVQKTRGPHGITLLAHAGAGGAQAAAVVKFLESLGDADPRYPTTAIPDAEQAALVGTFAFGSNAVDRLVVSKNARGALVIKREGATERNLFHVGALAFHPPGADAVRIRFQVEGDRATSLTIEDGDIVVNARRQ